MYGLPVVNEGPPKFPTGRMQHIAACGAPRYKFPMKTRSMPNPPHLGELVRESMEEAGWNVTRTADRLRCERGTLSRLLNGKAGLSANMALALEDIGWGTANHWMRMKASYELAQAHRQRVAAE